MKRAGCEHQMKELTGQIEVIGIPKALGILIGTYSVLC